MRYLIVGSEFGLGAMVKGIFMRVSPPEVDTISSKFDIHIKSAMEIFMKDQEQFDGLVYCAGINRISPFDDAPQHDFWESMDVNCYGFIHLIKLIREFGCWVPGMRCCLVTSNAANVAMRHSLAYNCSKAAANMAVKQMAREIPPTEQMIFGVAPNKLEGTPMSKDIEKKVCEMRGWTPEEAHKYQLEALPARKETDPAALAIFIHQLMTGLHYHPYIHGNILPFGGPV